MLVFALIALIVIIAIPLAGRVGRREERYTADLGHSSPRERAMVHGGTLLYTGRVAGRRKVTAR